MFRFNAVAFTRVHHRDFIANHEQDALEAYELNPMNFDLKPIRRGQVADAIHSVSERIRKMETEVIDDVSIQAFTRFEILVSGHPLRSDNVMKC